ncbi:ABC transporter permease subunit [Haloferula rosea]|uniref:ABC transporter permease subunit n=1 Tax=Haloferula rosea TaxID=490093 RepID=A0A934VH82_9BACT|nr:ABC transporter permease subunit [Haloferula rosea]MBK1828380.1 ABC transporter permease subunit [Haloferula rosea]
MTFPRKLGLLMILVAALAAVGEFMGWALPSLRWFFSFDADPNKLEGSPWLANQGEIIGYGFCGLIGLIGLVMIASGGGFHWNPLTLRKFQRFQSIGRGYASFRILMFFMALALCDQVLVGKRALAVRMDGEWVFPAFVQSQFSEEDFGGEGEQEVDYRRLKEESGDSDLLVILPPVPWDATFDSDEFMERTLPTIDGLIHEADGREPFSGFAYCYQLDDPSKLLRKARIREGKPRWSAEVMGEDGEAVGREIWENGVVVESNLPEGFAVPQTGRWAQRIYAPLPPSLERRHYLGTDSKGWDILAQLYGGLQVVFKGAVLYIFLTYGIGIVMGCLMGYFGGVYDLVMQRVMEIMSNVPFLLVVMIITNNIGRDNITLGTILLVFCIFSWIGVATYLRTSTYKEKARDYASAARVLGAGTPRVIFRHILPNAISTIVTLVPFSVSAVVTGLTALDFLGFGVPDSYPSWGRMLNDGLSNLASPWIVSSVFATMVSMLLLITFVGEAIREAFDPKKFTTYQ